MTAVRHHRFLWLMILCFPWFATSAAFAQEGASVFERGITRLAKERGLFFAVEGSPLQANRHEAEVTAVLESDTSTQTKVQRIAAFFDYRVKPSDNIYLLNKKYTQIEDLPCVTQEEIEAFVRNLGEMGVAYAPLYRDFEGRNKARSEIMLGILDSFDENQRETAFTKGVVVSEMGDAQKARFQSWVHSDVAGDLPDAAERFQSLFGNPVTARLTIQAGFDGREGIVFLNGMRQERTTALWDDRGRRSPAGSPAPSGSLPTVPRSLLTPPSERLAEVVGRISKGAKFRASAEIADKPVTIAGVGNTTPQQALNALARLYDLRVVSREGESVIERRTIRPSGFNRLALDIQAAVPLPLRNLLFRPLRNNAKTPPHAPSDCGVRAALYTQAVRSDISQSKNRHVSFATLPSRARAAVALFLLTVGNGTDVLDRLVMTARRASLFESEASRLMLRYVQPNGQTLDFEVGYNFSGVGGSYGYHGIGGGGPLIRKRSD